MTHQSTNTWNTIREGCEIYGYYEISHGTLRLEDLRDVFSETLLLMDQRGEYASLLEEAERMKEEDEHFNEVIDELADALDAFAPAGYYFGVSEGDGSCFGYWPLEPEEPEEDDAEA